MKIAVLDPTAGISGDMTLGALLSLGVPVSWLEGLPGRLGFDGVRVNVRDAKRCSVSCTQVEFDIPAQPHGRHVGQLVKLVEQAPLDRKSTRLNSSHSSISYAVFCLKQKISRHA